MERGLPAARRATVRIRNRNGEHIGQGLLLNLNDGPVILTCHHIFASTRCENLQVEVPLADGTLGKPLTIVYDEERSRPEQDAVVLRFEEGVERPAAVVPWLHQLGADTYEGAFRASVLTHLVPDNFDAIVRPSTRLEVPVDPGVEWPEPPECYRLTAFRLAEATYSRPGYSGGVVACEGGVLGLAHFGRAESEYQAREAYLAPLSVWAEGWPELENLIEPLVDASLKDAATVKRAASLSAGIGEDVTVANYWPEVYVGRKADAQTQEALEQSGGVLVVGRPLSGKSRTVVELLRRQPRSLVVIPAPHRPVPPEGFEASGFKDADTILLFDDLHETAETSQVLAWRRAFERATGRPCKVVVTVRDGSEWRKVRESQRHLLQELGEDATVYVGQVGEPGLQAGEEFSEDQGSELAKMLDMNASEFGRRFDGTPGSLLLDLEDMGIRYERLREEWLGDVPMSRLLDSVKLLHRARQPNITYDLARTVVDRIRGGWRVNQEIWDALLRRTREEGFLELDRDTGDISYYRPYLERCVSYSPSAEDLQSLQSLMEETGDSTRLFYLGAVYGHDLGDYEGALELAERALALDDEFVESWYNKSYALDNLGRHDEALEAVERALNLDPGFHPAYYSKAWALSHLGHQQEALENYRKAIELADRIDPGPLSMYLDGLSASLAKLGRFYEAINAGFLSLSLYPTHPHNISRVCNLLCGAGEPRAALKVAEHALEWIDDQWPEAWYGKAQALDDLARFSESLEACNQAIRCRHEFPEAWSRKGTVMLQMGYRSMGSVRLEKAFTGEQLKLIIGTFFQEAADSIKTAAELGVDYSEDRMHRAIALSHLNKDQEASKAFASALELEPENPTIHHNIGCFHLRKNRPCDALVAFDKALRLSPLFATSLWSKVLLLSGHFDQQKEALLVADRLTKIAPRDPQAGLAKACVLARLNRQQEAYDLLLHGLGYEIVPPFSSFPDNKTLLDFCFTMLWRNQLL